ncbi:MAG: tripartite tricarboxylate transporter TctB family protein [Hydrogenophaga sp.]|uniref:tripartite tricarboxylate transporter TctB family protein n=1 Tax=Hydrogenophaga sp. TaxID=1904254 RepID=UPI003D13A858
MTEGGKTARADLWGGAAWAGFGLLIVGESLRMDRYESMGAVLYTMPGFVPGALGSVVMLLGIVLMLRGWRRKLRAAAAGEVGERLFNPRIVITMVLSLLYAGLLVGRAPFWLVTALFVTAFVASFAPEQQSWRRRITVSLIAGLLTSAVVTLVFQHVFLVRLP